MSPTTVTGSLPIPTTFILTPPSSVYENQVYNITWPLDGGLSGIFLYRNLSSGYIQLSLVGGGIDPLPISYYLWTPNSALVTSDPYLLQYFSGNWSQVNNSSPFYIRDVSLNPQPIVYDLASVSSASSSSTIQTSTASHSTIPVADTSSSLSGGAIGGIVVGAILGIALLIAVGWFVIRRRRKAANSKSLLEEPENSSDRQQSELKAGNYANRHEIHGRELPDKRHEKDAALTTAKETVQDRHELASVND